MVDHNIKTLVTSVVRPYMTALKAYYSEMYEALRVKLTNQDDSILTTNQLIVELTNRVVVLEGQLLIAVNTMADLRSQNAAIHAALLRGGYDDVEGNLTAITDEWRNQLSDTNVRIDVLTHRIDEIDEELKEDILNPGVPEVEEPVTPEDPSTDITLTPEENSNE